MVHKALDKYIEHHNLQHLVEKKKTENQNIEGKKIYTFHYVYSSHDTDSEDESPQPWHTFIYHLSDDPIHDSTMTSFVLQSTVTEHSELI